MSSGLRDELAALVRSAAFPASDAVAEICDKTAEMVADRILAIPEIAEALAERARLLQIKARNAEADKAMKPAPLHKPSISTHSEDS